MTQQWRVGVSGRQRKEADIDLLIQAVIALGEQLRDEAHRAEPSTTKDAADGSENTLKGKSA